MDKKELNILQVKIQGEIDACGKRYKELERESAALGPLRRNLAGELQAVGVLVLRAAREEAALPVEGSGDGA